jgi:hypothetical protein
LVKKWGKVSPIGLKDRIDHAKVLVFYEEENKLVSVGAIKQPVATREGVEYRNKIFRKAKSKDRARQYRIELGWVAVNRAAHLSPTQKLRFWLPTPYPRGVFGQNQGLQVCREVEAHLLSDASL